MSEKKERKIKLADIKEHISCYLCKDYLTEATTIIECLHTFCRTCIEKYLKDNNNDCPNCGNVIHQSHPLQYISFDRTMQDIVYKVRPDRQPTDATRVTKINDANNNRLKSINVNSNHHRDDERINLSVRPHPSCDLKPLEQRYIRISCLATITHLKKYIALKIFGDIERYKELDIFCNDELQGKDHNFKLVGITHWRNKTPPIKLQYKPRKDYL